MNNVTIVGDPDQSIYGFRAAEYYNIKRFIEDYSPQVVFLDLNYRSNRTIVDSASALINDSPSRFSRENWRASREKAASSS